MAINIEQDTDTIDGRESVRQTMLKIVYFIFFILSWYIVKLIQYHGINFMLNDPDAATKWLSSGAYLPWNIALWGLFWVVTAPYILIIQGPNTVRVTTDYFNPEELSSSGATEFIVYGPGVSVRKPGESIGFEADIEKEMVHQSLDFTCSIKTISLDMKLMCMWTPLPRRLSVFFQNGPTDTERRVILEEGIMILAKQMAEVTASQMETAEHARAGQRIIADAIEAEIIPLAEEYGFQIKKFGFAKCDYPSEVQALLNKGLTAKTLVGIVKELVAQGVSEDKASELAPIYAGVNGVTIKRDVFQLEADEHVSRALEAMGPAMAALVAAWRVTHPHPSTT